MSIGGNNPDQSRYYNPSGPGINSVGSFQVSGRPFLTGSVMANNSQLQINFPTVTKELHFSCHTPGKYIINDSGATIEFELHAALTGIPTTSMFALSGSGINA